MSADEHSRRQRRPAVAQPRRAPAGQLHELRKICAGTLAANARSGTRDGVEYIYTAPSAGRYPWQWYWDSCFVAIAWRRFDRDRARAELETLLAAANADGFIGHTMFWGEPLTGVRKVFYNVSSGRDFMTATIQPPLLAWAWKIAVGGSAGAAGYRPPPRLVRTRTEHRRGRAPVDDPTR